MTNHPYSQEQLPANLEPNWAESNVGAATAGMIIAAEVTPINELLRVGAFIAAQKMTGDPILAASAAAGAAMFIEGVAAITTADLLATSRASSIIEKVNGKIDDLGASKYLKTNLPTEFGLANLGGTAVVTAVKHRQDTERTREQNRRYGLRFALGNAAVTGTLGFLVSEGYSHPNPVTIGLGALGVGAFFGGLKWTKDKITGKEQHNQRLNKAESPQSLGLSSEDAEEALHDPRTVSISENGREIPVLVPVDALYWYNHTYLKDRFGTEKVFYYAHPEVNEVTGPGAVGKIVKDCIEQDGVVMYDTVTSGDVVFGDLDQELADQDLEFQKVPITKDGRQRFLYQYDGDFIVKGKDSAVFKEAPSLYATYSSAVEIGELTFDAQNGPALAEIIEGEEADELWRIYHKPFERLSDQHPIHSGYNREEFLDILKDPEAVKAVFRHDGNITTLALFVNNLAQCTWLNADYYKQKYPEAVATGNHFIFPGIVTDELKRGASYSLPLIQLIAKTQALRETPAVISFECTDISYKYIPRIVRYAIGRSGVAKTRGFNAPVSRFDYYAITK